MATNGESSERDATMTRLLFSAALVSVCTVATADAPKLVRSEPAGGMGVTLSARTSPAAASVVGTWFVRAERMEIRIVLGTDGTFTHTLKKPEGTETTRGTYRLAAGILEARAEDEVYRLKCRMPDADTLELTDDEGVCTRLTPH